MGIGKQIKQLRNEVGLTQKEFSKKMSIHVAQLARYEAERSVPSIDVLKKIANYCEVSIDYLAFGKDKAAQKKLKISDNELLDIIRRIDNLKRPKRDQLKWIITAILKETTNELKNIE